MDLLDDGARAGTAGFVLSRLLLAPPSQALAQSFATAQKRETWPLRDPGSTTALERLGADPYESLPREYSTLFRRAPALVPLHESTWRPVDRTRLLADLAASYRGANFTGLPTPADDHVGYQVAYLAHLATAVGRGGADRPAARAAAETAAGFRAAHLDLVVDPILQGIETYARTGLYRALPGLLRGFLTEHARLCAAVLDHQPA